MKLYASFETNAQGGYGDSFPAFFFCEWLKLGDKDGDLDIYMWDQGAQGTGGSPDFRLRDHIEKPNWIAGWLDGPPDISDFDVVLATHYNHPKKQAPIMSDAWDPHHGGWLPPGKYQGAKFGILRMHNDADWANLVRLGGWKPTLPVLKDPPTVPDEPYIACQFRRNDAQWSHKPGRNKLDGAAFDDWALANFVEEERVIVSLSDQVSGLGDVDASGLSLWQKIYLAAHADVFYGAHSGFGAVCATYANKAQVINPNPEALHRNPTLAVFDNVTFPDDVLRFTAEQAYVDQAKLFEVREC